MNAFLVFMHKELLEQARTYKTAIMLAVFALFGMLSPLLAKIMPDVLASAGLAISLPEPSWIDAYAQFFKNMTQMGLCVLLLVFSGTVSAEVSRGTLINVLSKGVSRSTVILAKYAAALFLWTASYLTSLLLCQIYTSYLFGSIPAGQLAFSLLCLWLFGVFVLALLLAASTLVNGNYAGLLLTGGALVGLLMLNLFPVLARFSPIALASQNVALLQNTVSARQLLPNVASSLLLVPLLLLLALRAFARKQL